jgi:aminoglycoside N3'-acetyltransferase
MITKNKIIEDLKNLGIQNGDTLFITADLMTVGYFNKNRASTLKDWIDIFSTVVGEEGCFIAASYTKTFFRFHKSKDVVFNRYSKTDNGALSSTMINLDHAVRSPHPTNSCIGIGKNVSKYLDNNTHSSTYQVICNIMKDGGKFLMLGTIDKKNAPQAMHLVQEHLGYTKFSPYKWLFQTYYLDDMGQMRLYTKTDYGGCSAGGYKLFGPLLVNNAIQISNVGNAKSALMDAAKSYQVIKEQLFKNKRFILCDNSYCTQCYGNFFYNGFRVIPFFIKKCFNHFSRKKF